MKSFRTFCEEEDPCWDGYKQVGMKKKNGKMVPNCVPEETVTEGKLVKNMRVQHIHNDNKGTVVKGGDKSGGRVEVEWDNGSTTVTSGKYLKSIKLKEDQDLEESKKTWKKIKSYLLGKEAEVYTNDSGYTFGKVDGKWVMVDFDDEIVYKGKSAADMKQYYDSWLSEDYEVIEESESEGKTLNKPFRLPSGSNKKFGVYVKNDKGNVVKVTFGDPNMEIKRDSPERRKAFQARHNCSEPGPKWKARYWSCHQWRDNAKVEG